MTAEEVICLSVTEPGRAIGDRLSYRHVHGDPGETLRREWARAGGFVVVLAVGATVRLVAPLLTSKAEDPCVVCVTDAGRYAVVIVGGHRGGNDLALGVAAALGAEAVITTATDALGIPALDRLPGLSAEGDVARVTAALLSGTPVALRNELGWPLPDALAARVAPPGAGGTCTIVVTDRAAGTAEPGVVLLHPESLVVGVGCSSDADAAEAAAGVAAALSDAGLSPASVALVATVDRRRDHPAIIGAAGALGVPVVSYPASALDDIDVPTPSEAVRDAVGTGSVAEAAARRASGGGRLAVNKRVFPRLTVAVARRSGPSPRVTVVGLGPGAPTHRTPAAERAVRRADVVVGLDRYVEQCRDLLGPTQRVLSFALGTEVERARTALVEASKGQRVALVCSGDAGVYAMASPLMELRESAGVDVDVVPGVTAGLAAAALLGAPIGHDHALVSLSDLLTPWARIEERLRAAAASDFVVVLYNPRSQRRTWQLAAARDIFLEHRSPDTPVGVVTDAGRPGARVIHTTLEAIALDDVAMTSCVVVGSRATRMVGGRMVTPRGYLTWS